LKARIVERTAPDGSKKYVIQQKHFLFRWWWVDAWVNSIDYSVQCSYDTLEKAQEHLCWWDGTEWKDKVVA
jgi:hypothetical protein